MNCWGWYIMTALTYPFCNASDSHFRRRKPKKKQKHNIITALMCPID